MTGKLEEVLDVVTAAASTAVAPEVLPPLTATPAARLNWPTVFHRER
jgi:hypothetical protein